MDNNVNIFEQASRLKLRFQTNTNGSLSVDDLWDLPLTSRSSRVNLDDIARGLNRLIKQEGDDVSFVEPASNKQKDDIHLRFEIVKYIINVRVAERRAATEKEERAAKKQQLLEILSRKENAELEGKSVDELRAMVNAL